MATEIATQRQTVSSLRKRVAELRVALHGIVDRSENGELGTSKVQDMKATALAALASPALDQEVEDILAMSDEDILEEALATGEDIEQLAEEMRSKFELLCRVQRRARREGMEAAAREVDKIAARHRDAAENCAAEGLRDAAQLASYAARSADDIAAAIRAAAKQEAGDVR